jgi:hypothetical protein
VRRGEQGRGGGLGSQASAPGFAAGLRQQLIALTGPCPQHYPLPDCFHALESWVPINLGSPPQEQQDNFLRHRLRTFMSQIVCRSEFTKLTSASRDSILCRSCISWSAYLRPAHGKSHHCGTTIVPEQRQPDTVPSQRHGASAHIASPKPTRALDILD